VLDSLGKIIPIDFREFSKQKINALSSIVLNLFKPILCTLNGFGLGFNLYIRGSSHDREQGNQYNYICSLCFTSLRFSSAKGPNFLILSVNLVNRSAAFL